MAQWKCLPSGGLMKTYSRIYECRSGQSTQAVLFKCYDCSKYLFCVNGSLGEIKKNKKKQWDAEFIRVYPGDQGKPKSMRQMVLKGKDYFMHFNPGNKCSEGIRQWLPFSGTDRQHPFTCESFAWAAGRHGHGNLKVSNIIRILKISEFGKVGGT